jgi:hypothetical protein
MKNSLNLDAVAIRRHQVLVNCALSFCGRLVHRPALGVFIGIKGGPLRRSGFNKLTRWVDVVRTMAFLACTSTTFIPTTRSPLTGTSPCEP